LTNYNFGSQNKKSVGFLVIVTSQRDKFRTSVKNLCQFETSTEHVVRCSNSSLNIWWPRNIN